MSTQGRTILSPVFTSENRLAKCEKSTVLEQELGTLPVFEDAPRREPGVLTRLPWLGIIAFIGVLLFLGSSIFVLVLSNNKTQTPIYGGQAWPEAVAPNVLISIFNNAANMCFGVAISELPQQDFLKSSC
jgi:hypothetical protein